MRTVCKKPGLKETNFQVLLTTSHLTCISRVNVIFVMCHMQLFSTMLLLCVVFWYMVKIDFGWLVKKSYLNVLRVLKS